jgi:hypothetical protein
MHAASASFLVWVRYSVDPEAAILEVNWEDFVAKVETLSLSYLPQDPESLVESEELQPPLTPSGQSYISNITAEGYGASKADEDEQDGIPDSFEAQEEYPKESSVNLFMKELAANVKKVSS